MHSLGLIHNDIKLDNILVGAKDPSLIYLIDFGLASRYLDQDGNHIVKENLKKFSGNFVFASMNSCKGYSKSRRDDVQSAFFLLVYLLNDQRLPWSEFYEEYPDRQFREHLKERLDIKYYK
jgi:casein kinase 1